MGPSRGASLGYAQRWPISILLFVLPGADVLEQRRLALEPGYDSVPRTFVLEDTLFVLGGHLAQSVQFPENHPLAIRYNADL